MARDKTTTFSIRLTGDAAGAVGAIKAVSAQLAMLEGDYREVADKLNAESKRIEAGMARSANVAPRGAPEAKSLQTRATDRISNLADSVGLGEFSDDIAGAVTKLGPLGVALAGVTVAAAALGKALFEIGQFSLASMTELADEVGKLSATLGISTEEADRFRHAFSMKGVDTTQMIDALVQMQTNLQAAPEKFEALGIAQARFANGSADLIGTMDNLRAAWQSGDAGMRAQIGSIGLGEEAYKELIPWLMATQEETDALAASLQNPMSADDVARSKQYSDAMAALSESMKKAGQTIGSELAPYLVVLVDNLVRVVEAATGAKDSVVGFVERGVDVLKLGLESLPGPANVVGRAAVYVGEQWADGAGKVREAASVMGAAQAAMAQGSVILEGALKAEAEEQKRVAGLRNDLVGGYQDIADAKKTVQEAAQNYADVEVAANASVEQANIQADQTIANAAQNVADAHQAQSDAVADLAQAEADAGRTIADAAKQAAKQVESAQERLVDAREKQGEAAEDLAEAERDAQESIVDAAEDAADKIADAQDRVTDARERAARQARDNARSLVDAEDAVRQAINDSLTNDNSIEAQDEIARAYIELGRTKEDVADSEKDIAKDLADAEEGLRDAHVEAAKLRAEAEEDAEERINDARERLTDAIEGVAEAELGLETAIVEGEDAKARAAEGAASRVEAARSRVTAASLAVDTAETTFKTQFDTAQQARAKATEDAAKRVEDARDREKEAATKVLLHELEVSRIRRMIKNPSFVDRMAQSESNTVAESDTAAGNYDMSDLEDAYSAAGALPRFHGGGMFHAPTPGGEGLAILRDGETVLTPGQSSGGVTVQVIVQGSVHDEASLSKAIAEALRRGNTMSRS